MEVLELTAVIRRQGAGYVAAAPELGIDARGASIACALAHLKEAVAERMAEQGGAPAFFTRYEMA